MGVCIRTPAAPARTGRPRADDRVTINGILYVLTTGCMWIDMPARYGSDSTVHRRLQLWQRNGTWKNILDAARLCNGMLERILESFVLYCRIRKLFVAVDATGFGYGQFSYYYTKKYKLRSKFLKVSVCDDLREQIVCSARIRHKRRNDTVDFVPLLEKASRILPIDTSVADRDFDSESNHVGAEDLGVARCIIRPRYEHLQV